MRFEGAGLIVTSFLVAFWLSIYPLPLALLEVRPEWVALVLVYWVIAVPEQVGVVTAFSVGVLLDGFLGTYLGQHAFSLSVVAYICMNTYQRVRMFAVWQQAFFVFVLIGLHQLLIHWVGNLTGHVTNNMRFLLPALTSALIWPWLMVVLRGLRRRFGIVKQL